MVMRFGALSTQLALLTAINADTLVHAEEAEHAELQNLQPTPCSSSSYKEHNLVIIDCLMFLLLLPG
jgi:hypothetical protein